MDEEKDSGADRCAQCGEPGGRRRVDPYQKDVYDVREVVRIHDRCLQDRLDGI
jgi:hypothetical protein